MATITVLHQRQPSVQESLSLQQLREWAIWWGSPGGGASRASRRKPLSSQQRREWTVRWGAITGGTCESTAVSAASRRGGSGGGQQQQQRPLEALSSQQLREWAVRWGSLGGVGFRGAHTGGVEVPGGIEATSLNACDSASAEAEPEEALHTFTLDSGASRCFFRDSTTVTPLTAPIPVTLADPSGAPVVARGATILPCPADPSGLLTGLHLPLFAKNLVATSVLQDQWVIVTQLGGEQVAICTDSRTGEHLATFTRRPGSGLYTLTSESTLVAESGQGGERYFLLVVDDYTCYTTVFPLQSKANVHGVLICWIRAIALQLCARFREDLPVMRLHSDRGGEFFSHLLEDFCGAEGIVQSYTLPASPQQNEIAERRIGLVMEVARTSMIHAAAPHFLWPFAVRYTAEQLNLWPRVSHLETSPTLRWTGKVGDASAFRVWGSLSLVRDLPAGKLAPRTLRCVFLGFPTDTPPWQFYHPSSRCLLLPSSPPPQFPGSPPASLPCGRPPPPGSPPPSSRSRSLKLLPTLWSLAAPRAWRLSPERLREWAVCWGSPSGGAWRDRAAGSGGTDPGGASAGVPGVGSAGDTGARGTGATGGTEGAGAVGAAAGGPGSRCQEPLLPEQLREWAVRSGSPGGGAGRAGAAGSGGAGPGGASADVLGTGDTGAAGGTGGAGAAGGTGGAGPGGASVGVPGVGRAGGTSTGGGADTGGTPGGTGVSGPGGGAGGTGSRGAAATGAGGSGGATTQPRPFALRHLLSLPPGATEFPVAGTTPPLLFPPIDQSQPQLLPDSPLPAPAPHTEVTASLTARCEPKTRASTPERREPETRASVPARVCRVRGGDHGFVLVSVADSHGRRDGFLEVGRHLRVDFFQTFSPTLKMTTLRVLLHVVAHCDYELPSLDFLAAFLQGSLHEAIWLRRPRGFTGTTLAALGFTPSTAEPSRFLRTDTSLLPFYVLVYVDDLVFATANTEALALVKAELQERHTSTNLGPSALRLHVVLATAHSYVYRPLALTSTLDESVEPSGPYPELVGCLITSGMGLVLGGRGSVVLTGHSDASSADDQTTHRSTQGYSFSLGSGSVSWSSTCSSSLLSSSCDAKIYARALVAQELRWQTYLLTDLGERPRSPPVLYVDKKAMIALCQDHRLEHKTKHIALRYFLTRELQQRDQLRLAYVVTQANTADVFTKALGSFDHRRFCTALGLVPTLPHLLVS
ncbi:unnamed protein product [Closterium sp. NIES-53]